MLREFGAFQVGIRTLSKTIQALGLFFFFFILKTTLDTQAFENILQLSYIPFLAYVQCWKKPALSTLSKT